MTEARAVALLKTVILLENAKSVPTCLDYAMEAVRGIPATLRVLHVGTDPALSSTTPEEFDMRILNDLETGSAPEARRREIEAAFNTWKATRDVGADVILEDDEGDVERIVASETDIADLVVIARPEGLDGRDALRATLFKARRLLLVIPPDIPAGRAPLLNHVVIGWKSSAQAERMIDAILPWLQRADRITVLSVRRADGRRYGPDALAYFARLSLPFDHAEIERGTGSVGETLMEEAVRLGASCLGIGAYHHGQFWEGVFGGVTRDVLDRATLPVFIMH